MANGWTRSRRAKQAKAIHRWKPWLCSTGPKTPAGKAVVRMNSTKHGCRSAEMRAELAHMRELVREFEEMESLGMQAL